MELQLILDKLTYAISLPERTIRALAALIGGVTTLLEENLFPEIVLTSTFYRVFIGDMHAFFIAKVALVERQRLNQLAQETPNEESQGEESGGDYVPRKILGGTLETAGIMAIHFSPLWVFAIVSDATSGGITFLQRLVDELKQNEVLPSDIQIKELADVLQALQDAARKSASLIDTPPLSPAQIGELAQRLKESYGRIFVETKDLLPRLEKIWQKIEEVALAQKTSVAEIQGVMSLDLAVWSRKSMDAILSVGQVGGEMFGEQILASYWRTLEGVISQGLLVYVGQHLRPFWQTAVTHFDPATQTWTENYING